MKRRSFGKIQRMRSGRWQASYTDATGKRRTAPDTFKTKAEADIWLGNVRTMMASNSPVDLAEAARPFEGYALDWLADKQREVRPKTALLYADLLDLHLLPYLGAYPMKNITPAVVRSWRRWMQDKFAKRVVSGDVPRSDTTGETRTAQAYRLLHNIMGDAVREQVVTANPCNIRGAGDSNTSERKPATIQEVDIIAEHMPERYRALIHMAAWSGLRFSELAGLTCADLVLIKLGDGELAYRVNVNKQTYRVGGKVYEGEPTKTKAGRRVVVMPPHVTGIITAHMRQFTDGKPATLVFSSRNGTPISNNTVGKKFREARKAAGRDDLRFHDLRHTCATFATQTGASIREVMAIIGHSSPRAALIYQHATEGRATQIAEGMARLAEQERSKDETRRTLRVITGGKQGTAHRTATRHGKRGEVRA